MARRFLFALLHQKSRQSELFRRWLFPDDMVLFRWGDKERAGRVLALQRNSLLVDFPHGPFTGALRIPYDVVVRLVLPRELNQGNPSPS